MKTGYVIGGAAGALEEFDAAPKPKKGDVVIVVNEAGLHFPGKPDAWATLHGEKLAAWAAERAERGLPPVGETITGLSAADRPDVAAFVTRAVPALFDGATDGGSSGLFAAKVALVDLGCDRVILCGVPMTREAAHLGSGKEWQEAGEYHAGWRQAEGHLRGRAFSMSGWTRELLGEPADVDASRLKDRPAAPGHRIVRVGGHLRHWCPGCGLDHVLPEGFGFNGDTVRPTLDMPVSRGLGDGKVCRYEIADGKVRFSDDSWHELRGKTVDLPPFPQEGPKPQKKEAAAKQKE